MRRTPHAFCERSEAGYRLHEVQDVLLRSKKAPNSARLTKSTAIIFCILLERTYRMKHLRTKKLAIYILCLMLLLSLSGCGAKREDRYLTYVDSLISANYLNASEEYTRTTGASQEEADAMYLQNVTRLATNLENFYGLEISSDTELAPRMVELAKKIYSKARFSTDRAYKDNNIYYVDVTIYPIDLLNQTHDDILNYVNDFNTRVDNGDYNNYEKEDYEHEFASGIIDILEAAVDNTDYKEAETLKIRIIQSDSNFYISNEDFRAIDMAILSTDASKYKDATEGTEEASPSDAE